jgi:hypothetical protein
MSNGRGGRDQAAREVAKLPMAGSQDPSGGDRQRL